MAAKLTGLVLDHFHGDALCKLVFLTLADRANEHGICWPSIADLVARSGASKATVSRKLHALEAEGWIARKKRFQATTVFRLNVARLLRMAELAERYRTVPKGFEPFPEEVEAIEIEDKPHCEPHKPHCEPQKPHLGEAQTVINPSRTLRQKSRHEARSGALLLTDEQMELYRLTARPGQSRAEWLEAQT